MSILIRIILLTVSVCIAELAVTGNFDNGRVRVDSFDQANRIMWTGIPADNHTQDPQMRYYHMRITGMTQGEEITLHHTVTAPICHVYSYDRVTWFRFDQNIYPSGGRLDNLKWKFVNDSVEISPNIVYTYSQSVAFCDSMDTNPWVKTTTLVTSNEGRAVKMLRITDSTVPDNGKRIVWIIGRQHAFESSSSYVVEGFARWMASDDSAAAEFRQNVIAFCVPIMDVDNVCKGMSGKDQFQDYNRVWHMDPCPRPEVSAVKDSINAYCGGNNRLLAFIDCHQPYYGESNCWYVCMDSTVWGTFTSAYLASEKESGMPNTARRCKVASFDTLAPNLLDSTSYKAVRARWGTAPDYVGFTFESAHSTDDDYWPMLKEGYLGFGEAHGRALYKLIGGNRKPANIPPRVALSITSVNSNGICSFEARRNVFGHNLTSRDTDGVVIEYHWDFGDGITTITTGAQASHTYAVPGYFPVTLRVKDDDNAFSWYAIDHVKLDSIQGYTGVGSGKKKDPQPIIEAYPSPCNPAVTIILQNLRTNAIPEICVYDIAGKIVVNFARVHRLPFGKNHDRNFTVQWDGNGVNGKTAATGIYIVHVKADGNVLQKKVTLVR